MSEIKEDWCPTQQGSTTAYEAQMRSGVWVRGKQVWSEWERLPTKDDYLHGTGIPYPLISGGVFQTIGLYGHEQAQALAWTAAANARAQGVMLETRVVAYELKYDIKARRLNEGDAAPGEWKS